MCCWFASPSPPAAAHHFCTRLCCTLPPAAAYFLYATLASRFPTLPPRTPPAQPQVLGSGVGVYNPATNASSLNTANPPFRDTATLPQNGWVVLRFEAGNPGVREGREGSRQSRERVPLGRGMPAARQGAAAQHAPATLLAPHVMRFLACHRPFSCGFSTATSSGTSTWGR